MIFERIPTASAEGAILAHSVKTTAGAFKKGRKLSADDIAALTAAGFDSLVAARLQQGDMSEDEAATRIAAAASGPGTAFAASFTGRCNVHADTRGLAVVDAARVDALNMIDESVTIATLAPFEPVQPKQMVATIKIIPFAAPADTVKQAEAVAREGGPLVRIAPFTRKSVDLIMTRLPGTRPKVLDNTAKTVRARLDLIDAALNAELRIDHDEAAIASALRAQFDAGTDVLLVSGASAVVDRRDVVPTGVEMAGGSIEHFGMPVDPGNLLLLGHIGDKGRTAPVVGMPGCARSPKLNGFDWVMRRIAADIPVTRTDIMRMGAGGLLKEITTRPQPRDREAVSKRAPAVAALVLAAGQSRRMGATNKLLAEIDGVPMVQRIVLAACESKADRVVVVTGHESDAVRAALEGADVTFVDNPDYPQGLSTSLRQGLSALDGDADGALVCLGDMPRVTPGLLDRLIAAFDPLEGRAICVPTVQGKRGNPVLWGAQFFDQMTRIVGDVGARHLIGEFAESVCEVEVGDSAVLTDIDTPEALAAFRRRRSA